MVITVYDWSNEPKFIDETGFINLKDGTSIDFDASDDRCMTYYDGGYTVSDPEDIKKWLEFKPDDSRTISYTRRNQFDADI